MRIRSVVLGALLGAAIASPAAAAPPIHFKIDISDAEYEAFAGKWASDACGFAVTVDGKGHINIIVFDPPRGKSPMVEIDTYAMHQVFSANGKSVVVKVDAGPDLFRIDRTTGHLTLALTGRAITGSGVIGRFVIDLETDEVLFVAGNDRGDFLSQLCAALAP